jgi:DNA transposition AAA+ family ATPase
MENTFIETARVIAFREAAAVVADTAKGQPGFMVAWGRAGRGKTMCSKEYTVRTPETVYLRVFEDWTPRAMLARICHEINGMSPGTVARAKSILIEELDREPVTIIMDEADRLSNGNIEHLRDIHDETGAPIILVGEPSLYGRLTARRRIWERVTRVVEFGPVKAEDVLIFGRRACGLKIAPDAGLALVRRCEGSFRLLYHLMVDLERQAKANNDTKDISLEMIKALPNHRNSPTPEKDTGI